ncbi:Mss2 protein [Martiniozyma asiatica (nom. inval.)]|nr:Mss2 protein [Martiniozyma asiatica]
MTTIAKLLPKKIISRLLFDNNANFNYHAYLPVLNTIKDAQPKIPANFKGNDLLLFQRVLSQFREQTHTINPQLLDVEFNLIEIAAERGSRDALTTLSFMVLNCNNSWPKEDVASAKEFIKKLIKMDHPLVFKLSGDWELFAHKFPLEIPKSDRQLPLESTQTPLLSQITDNSEQFQKAVSFYKKFLTLDSNSTVAGSALRSLGLIYFKNGDLCAAQQYFLKSTNLSTSYQNAMANYFLGILSEHDPLLSRHYLELSAAEGFKDSFANLGYLELNVFDDIKKALEWFKLGSELGVPEAMVGVFDVNVKRGDWRSASNTMLRMKKYGFSNILHKSRADRVKQVKNKVKELDEAFELESESLENSRWN